MSLTFEKNLPELAELEPNENPDLVESPALLEVDPKENPVLDLSDDPNVGKVLADLLVSVDEAPKLNPDEVFLSSVLGVEPNVKGEELSEAFESDFFPKENDSFLSEVVDPKLNPAEKKKNITKIVENSQFFCHSDFT